jgi:hypothetical protein
MVKSKKISQSAAQSAKGFDSEYRMSLSLGIQYCLLEDFRYERPLNTSSKRDVALQQP